MSGYEIVVYGKGRQMFAAYTEMQVIEILRCLRGIADDLSAPGTRLDSTLLDFWGEAANDLAMALVGNAITSFWTFPPTPVSPYPLMRALPRTGSGPRVRMVPGAWLHHAYPEMRRPTAPRLRAARPTARENAVDG
jgi:hypothetical protein